MKYQLTLQWPLSSIEDYNEIIEVERELIQALSSANVVDGHDAGSGQINIFILTDDPDELFSEILNMFGQRSIWSDVRIAHRDVNGFAYTIMWPKNLTTFSIT